VLGVGFTEKDQLTAKTDRNSIFLGRKAHILDRLHIIVLYISLYEFLKIQILAQNAKRLAFGFIENVSLREKLTETLYFLVVKTIFWISWL
jgi:hypothetical protein